MYKLYCIIKYIILQCSVLVADWNANREYFIDTPHNIIRKWLQVNSICACTVPELSLYVFLFYHRTRTVADFVYIIIIKYYNIDSNA